PAGTYTLTITGRDGRKSRSASVRLSVEEVFSPEQLLKLAEERRDTYDMLYKVLDPKEVSIQIQEEYARVYRDMWEDLYDVAKSGDSPEAIVGIFELVLNAISKLDRMGKLLYLQNILIRPEFTQLETYIGQMRDLTDREIIAIRNRDFNSLKNIYDQEQRTLIDIKNHLSIRVKPSLDNLIRSWVEYQAPITKSENIGKLDVGETNSKEIIIQVDADASYFNVYVIEGLPQYGPFDFLFPRVGEYRVEIYDWMNRLIAQEVPSHIYRSPPNAMQLQIGIASPSNVGAVQIRYDTLKSLMENRKLYVRIKIVCLEKPKGLFGWPSATPSITLLIDMRAPSEPIEHPTTYETYAYEYLNGIILTLDNAVNAEQIYINNMKQRLS
ncbi:hypothetical protein KEJ17_06695, partial [Candidatus Bathyarchaeota archaeon]|nr:hypothetical protein [Candidatus Bathyarchaeota archaeon]